MPYKVTEDLYSDTSPNDANWQGTVSTGTGNFQIKSAGGALSDDEAARFGLTGTLEHVTQEQLSAEHDARNRQTYADNAANGGALRVSSVAPEPESPPAAEAPPTAETPPVTETPPKAPAKPTKGRS